MPDNIFKIADFVFAYLTASLPLGDNKSRETLKHHFNKKTIFIFEHSLCPSGKLPVRNLKTKSAIMNILLRTNVLNAVEKRIVRSTELGSFISP